MTKPLSCEPFIAYRVAEAKALSQSEELGDVVLQDVILELGKATNYFLAQQRAVLEAVMRERKK